MSFLKDIIAELKQEGAVTRRFLEQVDFQKSDFQPTEQSEHFGRLAIHVAEIIAWWKNVVETNELNFLGFEPAEIKTTEALVNYFDELLEDSLEALKNTTKEELQKEWSMTNGDEVLFTLNKKEVLRKFCLNHLIHHRAQLGVYFRLLRITVPATYGPSADDWEILLTESYS